MRLEMTDDGLIVIALSRRNLLAGLHKLDMPGSYRTLFRECPEHDKTLVFHVEDDEEHYGHPSREGTPAGLMYSLTESFIGASRMNDFPADWPEIAWSKLPVDQRVRAVGILHDSVVPEFMEQAHAAIEEKGLGKWMPPCWHLFDGMHIRNLLRVGGFADEELPSLPELYGKDVSTWDDFYVQVVEAAVGARLIEDGAQVTYVRAPERQGMLKRLINRIRSV